MAPFSKPETVLKQAEGLISVGQTHAALQSLSEMFSSKRFRSTPLTSLEPIMLRFIELCVEMRKGRTAKEGLMQYKNIAQNASVGSVEIVVNRFVALGEAKVKDAQEKSEKASALEKSLKADEAGALEVDDLEASETPESILLGAVSGDQSKDRTDRALVTPWLKFLWESYRTSLETLKNNARLEVIYQQIAQQAFRFCLKHQRKVEFRRLCETLRLHLSNVAKYSHQPHSINLSDPDTLQHHLDTRFAQLNTSVELELWQEAFRSVEDVHNLLTLAKKAPRPAMMANYYEKCTKIFLMSGNALFHAAAWGRYYSIVISIGGRSEEELAKLAGQVLVSALAVPVGLNTSSLDSEEESVKGKNSRLTALLGLSKMPTRASLLREALSRDVLKLSPPTVRALYNLLEVTFDPLSLCADITPLFQSLATPPSESDEPSTSDLSHPSINYAPYLPLLHQALLSRLLSHLSQVYSSIKVNKLLALIAPIKAAGVEGAYDESQIEAYVMGCARRGELNVRVDHADGCIVFIDEPYSSITSAEDYTALSTKDSVQPALAELVRTRLGSVAMSLHNSLKIIDRSGEASSSSGLSAEEQSEKLKTLVAACETERKALKVRRALVARRRELLSESSVRKEKEESSRRAEINRREREEEAKKAKEDVRLKEIERNRKERENIRIAEAKKYAQSLLDIGVLKANDVEKLETFDTEELIGMQVQHLEKEKKETTHKLKSIAKRIDHLERAYRKEERPLLDKDYEQQQKADRDTFNAIQISLKEQARLTHRDDLATKARLLRMVGDYEARKSIIIARKGEDFAKRKDAAQRKISEEKAKRKKSVLKAQEEERRRIEEEERLIREQEEEERREEEARRAEEEARLAEAEAAAAAEEAAKREAEEQKAAARKAREEERAAGMEQARLQAQREEEAEQRRLQRAAERNKPASSLPPSRSNGVTAEPAAAWRRPSAQTPANSVPGTPTRANAFGGAPPRSESPAPAVGKYRPGALAAGGGGKPTWREREEAKQAGLPATSGTDTPVRTASPAPPPAARQEAKADDDGFTTVTSEKKGVWKPKRFAGAR